MKYVLAFIISMMSLKAFATSMYHHGIEYYQVPDGRYVIVPLQPAAGVSYYDASRWGPVETYIENYHARNMGGRDTYAERFYDAWNPDADWTPPPPPPMPTVVRTETRRTENPDGTTTVETVDHLSDGTEDITDTNTGIAGPRGERGETGPQGPQGERGEQGERGNDGRDGIDGTNGRDGIDGNDGRDGRDGVDGVDGRDGDDFNGNARLTHIETVELPAIKTAIEYNTQRINENSARIDALDLRINSYQAISGATDAAIGSIGGRSGLGVGTSSINGIEAISIVSRHTFDNDISIFGAATRSEDHEQYSVGVGISW